MDMGFLKLNLKSPVVFIYSGNIQKWQNIPQILNFIKRNDSENHIYIFLSREKEYFINIINIEFKKIKNRFIVESVLPEELYKYYNIAHYGFMIRDDHILNKVACPTKMIEYLFYGIIPIIELREIGDFSDYDYIKIDEKTNNFYPRKSEKNKNSAIYMLQKYDNLNPLDKIFSWSPIN